MSEIKIKTSELNEICEIAKMLMTNNIFKQDDFINKCAFTILQKAQAPLQESDPQNV